MYVYVLMLMRLSSKGMHLRDCPDLTPGNGDRYVRLYRAIAEKTALLVSEWMRVGYVQGYYIHTYTAYILTTNPYTKYSLT